MRAATGCAFACHTMQPHDDNIYVRDNNGQNIWLDNAMVPRRITGTQTISGQRYVKYNNASGAEVKKLESSGYYADSYWLAYNNQTFNGKRSEEHTSELQSLMRISYAVFCLKHKTKQIHIKTRI